MKRIEREYLIELIDQSMNESDPYSRAEHVAVMLERIYVITPRAEEPIK